MNCGQIHMQDQSRHKLPNLVSSSSSYRKLSALKHLLTSIQKLNLTDKRIYEQAFKFCGDHRAINEIKQVHGHMIVNGIDPDDRDLGSKLVAAYAKCGCLAGAHSAFEGIRRKTPFSWNALLIAYANNEHTHRAFEVFREMTRKGVNPGKHTFTFLIKACSDFEPETRLIGLQLHTCVVKNRLDSVIYVKNALISMYAKGGFVEDARRVFDEMPERDVVSWNALITGYVQNGRSSKAIAVFTQMQDNKSVDPNAITLVSVITACADLGDLKKGMDIHDYILSRGLETNVPVWNALITLYCKCSSLEDARHLFDSMPERDVVSWNAIIGGYAQNGQYDKALELFHKIELEGQKPNVATWNGIIAGYAQNKQYAQALKVLKEMQLTNKEKPNHITITIALPLCAQIAALKKGRELHTYITKTNLGLNVSVATALIDMYSKCGNLRDARHVFDRIRDENSVVLWTAIISGYAMHGLAYEALALFHAMRKAGMRPDNVTFTAILSACSHAGLQDEGWECFNSMSRDYNLNPSLEQYTCMVDLLCRTGCVDEAAGFVKKMPIEPDPGVYGSLLAASRIYGNVDVGEAAAERLFEMEPQNSGNYVLLANLYYETGRCEDAARVRKLMKARGVMKSPGCSWIEVNNKVHVFVAGDRSHPATDKIYDLLEKLWSLMKVEGYFPNRNDTTD